MESYFRQRCSYRFGKEESYFDFVLSMSFILYMYEFVFNIPPIAKAIWRCGHCLTLYSIITPFDAFKISCI